MAQRYFNDMAMVEEEGWHRRLLPTDRKKGPAGDVERRWGLMMQVAPVRGGATGQIPERIHKRDLQSDTRPLWREDLQSETM
jgi:hypothetical protein